MTDISTFDVIVVGAGSAGCVLASRLSEDPARHVLLLEAGGSDEDPRVSTPATFGALPNTRFDWGFRTAPQDQLSRRQIAYPRGRVIGGTGSINYMIYLRGHRSDYDTWQQLGATGWGWDDVLPFFRKAENWQAPGESDLHGDAGPLSVTEQTERSPLTETFLAACQQAGIPFNPDLNGGEIDGCGYFPATLKDNARGSTARTYLRGAEDRANLTIVTGATALRLVFDGPRVAGLDYLVAGEVRRASAQETVLSAGSVGSPHILQVSGIGAADRLREVGVEVRHDLPGVGENLQDHLHYRSRWEIDAPLTFFGRTAEQLAEAQRQYAEGRGPLTTNHFESGAFLRSAPGVEAPDIELLMIPYYISLGAPEMRPPDRHGFTISGFPTRPRSTGRVSIASADPLDRPIIDPGYLKDPADIQTMLACIRAARRVVAQEAFADLAPREISPGPDRTSDDALIADIREVSSTSWHPVGSCRMGQDAGAVVGPDLRVHGLDGLSIADASVMPRMNTGHPQAPVIMIAEKAADMIAERA
ncbi:GMC family oxidoreductase [Jannaschia seohaensis]|uniref:Choline dehydrogenase n=1 Tax=Jannaschia seohaensis TaxID=475081 RepID=A0A2Y9B5H5_9RHOB|nr:GMC family oxidoreductase N-terminal domain-containing protein [Jannaschia seohaensis]PWJ10497.1 choline dehydrogenase-like flavoprotein [Jannaschia seohaensis]SSA51640.1 Choline dehydrogenase [Jannaschia seohaensis]